MRQESYEERARRRQNRRRVGLPTLFVTALLALLLGGALTLGLLVGRIGENGLSVIQAMGVVRSGFVGEYDWDEVTDQTLDALVASLGDRWSYYLTEEEYRQVLATRSNAYVGIGVTIATERRDAIYILSVQEGSPAQEAEILAQEAVVAVNGQRVTEDSWQERMEAISGAAGSNVSLTVRDAHGAERELTLTRREIHTNPVEYERLYLADGRQVGLIRLKNFYSGSGDAFTGAVDALTSGGAEALVIDLRNNPGGYVTELTKILDSLLPEGVIFQSEDLSGKQTTYSSDAACVALPCVTIVNGESYSASEFLAAQLQESVEAAIVGEPTSGKGYAQQLFALRNGSAIGVSTSRYVTGEGTSLVGTGLTPEPLVTLSDEEYTALLRGELSHEDDPQLQAALALLLAE